MVRFRKLVAKQMKHAAGDVKLTRYLQVQQVIADQIARQAGGSLNLGGGNQQLVVDQPIAKRCIVPRNIICRPRRWIA